MSDCSSRAFKVPKLGKNKDQKGLTMEEPRLYNIWTGMIHRCENPERTKYKDYGGRGISVCDEWHEFPAFVEWARQSGYEEGRTIDRINVNGNYNPDNCRWATNQQQSNNKRNSVLIECEGICATAKQWADLVGMSQYTIYEWVRVGGIAYAAERITEKIRNGKDSKHLYKKVCEKCGIEFETPTNIAHQKYCQSCSKEARRERDRIYWHKRKGCGARVEEVD